MGWTSMRREKGQTDREFWTHELNWGEPSDRRREILDCATIANTFYAAVKEHGGPNDGKVWALVVRFARVPRSYYNYTYKEMDETVGPFESACPDRILDLLTETDSKYALEWRARCREFNARPKPRKGDKVMFAHPMRFTDGSERDTFIYEGGSRFRVGFTIFKISDWKQRKYSLAPA